MAPEQIQQECEKMYAQINLCEEQLSILRKMCKHEKTFVGDYQWRLGSIIRTKLCKYCLTPLQH